MLKKIIFLQIFLLIFWSCKQKEVYKTDKEVIISGQVSNFDPQKDKIELHVYSVFKDREIITSKLDSSGNFKFSFNTLE